MRLANLVFVGNVLSVAERTFSFSILMSSGSWQ
jgi:hypothetical protein